MTQQEREEFLGTLDYFHFEKGNASGFSGFSEEKLQEADPTLAHLYKQMVIFEEAFASRLRDIQDE